MPSPKLKRTPVQERSHDTVQHILDSASKLLTEAPLEHITTSRIATAAGVSIGGLYRFFPDKQSIIDAIAVRRVEEFQFLVEQSLSRVDSIDGPVLLDVLIDAYVDFLDQRPDFRAIALGRHVSALTREQQVDGETGPAALVKMFLADGADLKIRIAIEAGERLIDLAFSQPCPAERAAVIREMKLLLSRYLF